MHKIRFSRTAKALFLILAVALLVGSSGWSGYLLGERHAGTAVPGYVKNATNTLSVGGQPASQVDFKLFWEAWNIIDENFYGDKSAQNRLNGAISGMVAGLKDPYTFYMEPVETKQFRSDLQGSFGGIGAELTVKNGLLTIVSALSDTPAEKAGLKGQDVILEIDGKKTAEMNLNDAIDKIRGNPGTQVELTIGRVGVEKPFKVKLTRETITVKSVTTSEIGDQGSIAYIKVNQFGDDTTSLLRSAFTDAKQKGKKGVVLDLRDNPGGFLSAAVDAIGMVLPDKITQSNDKLKKRVAVIEKSRDNSETDSQATQPALIGDLPLVVVVNGGSASASEIFAGAMKDYGRAKVVGTKTFGKGSVQNLLELDNGGSIKVTIAKWFTPLGTGIDGKGINPDVVVELPENTPASTTDAQVTKALEYLK